MRLCTRIVLTSLGGMAAAALLGYLLTSGMFFSLFDFKDRWLEYAEEMAAWHAAHPTPETWADLDAELESSETRWSGIFDPDRRQVYGIPMLKIIKEAWLDKLPRTDAFYTEWYYNIFRMVLVPLESRPGYFFVADQWGAAAGLPPPDTWIVRYLLWIRLGIIATVVALVAVVVAYQVTRPVRRLRDYAQAVEAGQLDREDPALAARTDELGAVAHEIARLAHSLRERLWRQRAIVANVSSMLGTPVRQIRMTIAMVRADDQKDGDALGGSLMSRLENDVAALDTLLERLGADLPDDVEPTAVDLRALCLTAVDKFQLLARQRGLCLNADVPAEPVTVSAHQDLLSVALDNIIDNAVKYGSAEAPILVMLSVDADNVALSVANRGPLITQDDNARLFDPFFRLPIHESDAAAAQDAKPRPKGSGVGLAIVRRAIELHHGTVQAVPDPRGGLTMRIDLPRQPPVVSAGRAAAPRPAVAAVAAAPARPSGARRWLGEGLYLKTAAAYVVATTLVLAFAVAATSPQLFTLFRFEDAWQTFATNSFKRMFPGGGGFYDPSIAITARPDYWDEKGQYMGPMLSAPRPPHIARIGARYVPAHEFREISAPDAADRSFVFPMIDPPGWTVAVHQPADAAGLPPPGSLLFNLVLPIRLLLLLLGFALAAFLYAVYVNRPIRRIADFVKQAAAGDAASLPPALLQRRDEIGGLARDLDIMLSRQSAHLARQHQIVRDITHELRSPLARLRVATSLLAGRNGADDGRLADAAAVGDQVETDIATLDGLIDRILMLARLDSPDWRNKLELFDIRDLFREAADRAKGACKAQAGGAAPATGLYVRGDRRLLGEAMAHLIDHICGLAGSRSPVRLELRHEALQARLRILLDGPNIRSRGLRKLTEPASTGDSGDGAVDPADIGLVIARRIAEMHGGEIVALPRWLPQGVAIEMTVPLAFNPVAAAA